MLHMPFSKVRRDTASERIRRIVAGGLANREQNAAGGQSSSQVQVISAAHSSPCLVRSVPSRGFSGCEAREFLI